MLTYSDLPYTREEIIDALHTASETATLSGHQREICLFLIGAFKEAPEQHQTFELADYVPPVVRRLTSGKKKGRTK